MIDCGPLEDVPTVSGIRKAENDIHRPHPSALCKFAFKEKSNGGHVVDCCQKMISRRVGHANIFQLNFRCISKLKAIKINYTAALMICKWGQLKEGPFRSISWISVKTMRRGPMKSLHAPFICKWVVNRDPPSWPWLLHKKYGDVLEFNFCATSARTRKRYANCGRSIEIIKKWRLVC